MLVRLSDEGGAERSLLICCSAFRCDPSRFPNLTIKKIPKAVLKKCEWGHDDYSLEVENLPVRNDEGGMMNDEEEIPVMPRRKFGEVKREITKQQSLLDVGGDK